MPRREGGGCPPSSGPENALPAHSTNVKEGPFQTLYNPKGICGFGGIRAGRASLKGQAWGRREEILFLWGPPTYLLTLTKCPFRKIHQSPDWPFDKSVIWLLSWQKIACLSFEDGSSRRET